MRKHHRRAGTYGFHLWRIFIHPSSDAVLKFQHITCGDRLQRDTQACTLLVDVNLVVHVEAVG